MPFLLRIIFISTLCLTFFEKLKADNATTYVAYEVRVTLKNGEIISGHAVKEHYPESPEAKKGHALKDAISAFGGEKIQLYGMLIKVRGYGFFCPNHEVHKIDFQDILDFEVTSKSCLGTYYLLSQSNEPDSRDSTCISSLTEGDINAELNAHDIMTLMTQEPYASSMQEMEMSEFVYIYSFNPAINSREKIDSVFQFPIIEMGTDDPEILRQKQREYQRGRKIMHNAGLIVVLRWGQGC